MDHCAELAGLPWYPQSPMSAALPTVVIVGRPNVGKSTLFNRIAGRRIAVVQDTPGVTRDRLYAECEHHGRRFQLVDTGGLLFGDDDPLVEQIKVQAEVAISEADVVLFMVDAADGPMPGDWDLANRLRGFEKPVFLVVNKADNKQREQIANEFYALGVGELVAVSAVHGTGVDSLFDDVVKGFPKDLGEMPDDTLKLAIIGRPNVGKSSMLNALVGEERAIVSDIPGTTRDAIDTPIVYKGQAFRLIDTAGIRRRGKVQGSVEYYMVLRATRALERADCALVVVDGVDGLTDGDKRVMKSAHDLGKPLVIAVNKWDLREPPTGELGKSSPVKRDFLKTLSNEIPEVGYAIIRFTSALESSGLDGVMKAVRTAYENWNFRATTGELNRIVQDATFEKPLVRKGKPAKVRFVTQPETRPPTIVMFVNDPDLFHFSYIRYLENSIRKVHPLEGTPLRVVARRSSGED
jgi:GTP-binding protein